VSKFRHDDHAATIPFIKLLRHLLRTKTSIP
jgi:hypothetical protein